MSLLAASLLIATTLVVQPPSASGAVTGLTDCRFSSAQVFDVQWSISGGMLNISGITRPYASNEPRSGQLLESEIAGTDTFAFYVNGDDVGFRQFDADGAVKNTLHLRGNFQAVGEDFLFYLGDGFWGTVITTGAGFAYGSSASLEVDAEDVTLEQALAYSTCSATPLAVGQTRDSVLDGGGGGGGDGDGDGPNVSPGPQPPDGRSGPVAAAVELAAGLAPLGAALVRDGAPTPVTTSTGPRGALTVTDPDGKLQVTLTTVGGVSPSRGLVVAPDGEIVCEICAQLAAGTVVEAWIYSEPRLAAAVRVDVEDGICPLLRIPVGAPLDGGGGIAPGVHTLQLRMDTSDGFEILAIPITVGDAASGAATLVPTRVNTGGGPVPTLPMSLALGLLAAVAGLLLVQRDRELAWAHAWAARQRRRQALFGLQLPAFDALHHRLDRLRGSLATVAFSAPVGAQDATHSTVEHRGAPAVTPTSDPFDALAQRLERFRGEHLG
jgi:hypothetical protein